MTKYGIGKGIARLKKVYDEYDKRVITKGTVQVGVSAVAAGSATEVPVFKALHACTLTKVGFVPKSAITGADTNYMTLSFVDKGSDGTGTGTIASRDYSSGNDVAAMDFEDSGTLSNASLAEGDTVSFKKAETGTGMAMPDLIAVVEFERA